MSEEELTTLKLEAKELEQQISVLEITPNRLKFARNTIPEGAIELRHAYTKRLREIQKVLLENKKERGKSAREDEIFKELLNETFGRDDYLKIMREYRARSNGEAPTRVTVVYKDSELPEQRKLTAELFALLVNIRKTLTLANIEGCAAFDPGEFMKVISPLNRLVPTTSDLNRMQRVRLIKDAKFTNSKTKIA